ncbi:hypothetical protein LguiA_034468 [Lonicera macranthoides]
MVDKEEVKEKVCGEIPLQNEVKKSINNPESPDLPSWVKFSEDKIIKNQEDDFVLPSISYWIENQNLHDQKVGAKSLVRDTANDDVDKISKILKK